MPVLKYNIVMKVKYESDVDRRRISGCIGKQIIVMANGHEVNIKPLTIFTVEVFLPMEIMGQI